MKSKIFRMSLLIVMIVLVVAACTPAAKECPTCPECEKVSEQPQTSGEAVTATQAEASTAPETKMKIGILTMGLAQPYFVELSQGYKDMAAEYPGVDVEVIEVDPNFDAEKQVSAIENFMELGVDAFIITAIDPEVVNSIVKEAMVKGIKVIAHYNILGMQTLHSGVSPYGMGFVAGQQAAGWINDKLGGSAEVALLVWDKTEFDIDRTEGMRDAISAFAPGATIVQEVAADTIPVGMSAAETILQAHPDVKVFVCYNGEGCMGALSAVEAADKATEDFGIFGVNASQEELSKIKEGTVYRGSVSIDPYNHGRLEMEMAIRLILGDFIPASLEIQPVPVDASNLDQFYKE